jgi:hypothetical protein
MSFCEQRTGITTIAELLEYLSMCVIEAMVLPLTSNIRLAIRLCQWQIFEVGHGKVLSTGAECNAGTMRLGKVYVVIRK